MPIDIPMRFADAPLLWTIADVYTPEECAVFVRMIDRAGPTLATGNPVHRDQDVEAPSSAPATTRLRESTRARLSRTSPSAPRAAP